MKIYNNIVRYFTFLFVLVFLGVQDTYATHNRAGEITYEYLGGLTYRFTIRICSNEGSSVADRPELEIYYGDGQRDTVPRVSEIMVPSIGSFSGSENIYIATHTYQGPNTYYIEVLDPNRNQGILNITNSISVAFCLRTVLVISPFFSDGNNSSVPEEFPCPELGCVNQVFIYNSAAFDPDGDSLSYQLVPCMAGNGNDDGCDPLTLGAVYQFPHQVGGGTISINASNGTVTWNAPGISGEYNFAVLIKEWRYGIVIGEVLRDIQVTIIGNCNNDPPTIDPLTDTCVIAGGTVNFSVHAEDPNAGNLVFIDEYGQPFSQNPTPATFTLLPSPPANPINGTFNWITDCSDIRAAAYQVFFIARDNDTPVPLVAVQDANINVNPPAVTSLTATPFANSIILNWTACSCTNIKGYKIYRKLGTGTPANGCCDENTPINAGYTLVGNVIGVNNTTFTDNNSPVLGNEYCYVVVVYSVDGAHSCPSPEACASLRLDVPVITKVSVEETDLATGVDTLQWFYPVELDTISQWPGPYFYKIYRANGFANPTNLIFTTPLSASLALSQQELIVNSLNTSSQSNSYKVELWHHNTANNTDTLLGPTNPASSIFLSIIPSDNQLFLTWQESDPWVNFTYDVYKEVPIGSGTFVKIGNTDTTNYMDTGLINGFNYCYYIVGFGNYSAPEIPAPLINVSQIACAAPVDLTAPCPPVLSIENNCEIPINILTWNNPNNSCADDVMSYNVYFTPIEGDPFVFIGSLNSASDTSLQHILANGSVAGCYYVTAIDSVQYGNESIASNIVCGDNCPIYFLPNVFSPNGDGDNDLFVPFPYAFVDSIKITIYDRWGVELFSTTDPDIRWDGTNELNGKLVPDGVYYYTCTVYTIRLTGIEPVQLNGFLHLYSAKGGEVH